MHVLAIHDTLMVEEGYSLFYGFTYLPLLWLVHLAQDVLSMRFESSKAGGLWWGSNLLSFLSFLLASFLHFGYLGWLGSLRHLGGLGWLWGFGWFREFGGFLPGWFLHGG